MCSRQNLWLRSSPLLSTPPSGFEIWIRESSAKKGVASDLRSGRKKRFMRIESRSVSFLHSFCPRCITTRSGSSNWIGTKRLPYLFSQGLERIISSQIACQTATLIVIPEWVCLPRTQKEEDACVLDATGEIPLTMCVSYQLRLLLVVKVFWWWRNFAGIMMVSFKSTTSFKITSQF